MSIESVLPSNHLILCHPLLLLPSIFPSLKVFSNESALHIKWPKYWSFNFSISPSNEFSGLISFRIDWFDLDTLRDRKNKVCTILKIWGLSSAYRGPNLLTTKQTYSCSWQMFLCCSYCKEIFRLLLIYHELD